MAGNKITRQDIADDKVFTVGADYAKTIQDAIDANTKWMASFAPIKKSIEELNNIQKQFKAANSNQQFISAKQSEAKVINEVTAAIKVQQQAQNNLILTTEREKQANSQLTRELTQKRVVLQQVNQQNKQSAVLSSSLSTEYQKQNIRLEQLRKSYKDLATRQEIHGNLTKKEVAEMKRLEVEARRLDLALKRVDSNVGQSQRNVGNYSSALKGLGSNLRSLVSAFGLTSGVFLFASAVKDAFSRVREFDKSMQNLAGVMRVTRKDNEDLEESILKVAGVTVRTSNEVAKLAESLATLGKSKTEIKELLKPVIDLSLGLDAPADEAGEFLVQMLNAFQKSTDSAEEFADTIATIRTSTTLDFQKMRDSFQYIAPISNLLNKDLAYTGAVVGILADNGLKAESAGRLLSTALIKLATANKTLPQALDEINQLYKEGATELEILAKANELFGKQSAKIGAILAINTDAIELNAQAIRDNGGALKDLTDRQLESLDAKIKILDSSYERFILTIEKGDGAFSKFLISRIEDLTKLFGNLALAQEESIGFWDRLKLTVNSYGKTLSYMAPVGFLIRNLFEESTDELVKLNSAMEDSINDINRQNEAFIQLHGSLAPLTEAQQKVIDNQQKINSIFGSAENALPPFINSEDIPALQRLRGELQSLKDQLENLTKNGYDNLTDAQAESVVETRKAIKEKQQEIDAILGIEKATKKAVKAKKEEKDFTFETNKFINETKIKFLEDFANDEKRDFDLRQTALKTQADLELALVDYVTENKLKKVKKGSEEERYILIKAEAEKQAIIRKFESESDNIALEKIKANAETKAAIQEKLLNEELTREDEYFEATKDQYKDLEEATEAHEKRVAAIKKKYAIQALQDQITAIEELLKSDAFSAEERIQLEAKIAAYKQAISKLNTEVYEKEGKKRVLTEEEVAREILRLSSDLANALVDIIHNLSEARIQNYEREIDKSDEKYDKLLEDENLYEEDRKRIEETKERARKKLEREIAKEKRKQAILDKALAAVQIGINTAVNISKVTPNPILIALVAALGAAQLAAVAATPIPAYAKGTEDHKGGLALVGEERPEVITEPNKAPYIVSTPTVLNLPKHTKVTPSLEEYEQLMRASTLASVHISNNKMSGFQAQQAFDSQMAKEMRLTRETIKRSKPNVIFKGTKAPNLPYEFFRFKNTNWRG